MEPYVKIPLNLLKDNRICNSSKCLYGLINLLSIKNGYCYGSNKYLADQLHLTTRTITRLLSELSKYGYVDLDIGDLNNRKIYVNNKCIYMFDYDWLNENIY